MTITYNTLGIVSSSLYDCSVVKLWHYQLSDALSSSVGRYPALSPRNCVYRVLGKPVLSMYATSPFNYRENQYIPYKKKYCLTPVTKNTNSYHQSFSTLSPLISPNNLTFLYHDTEETALNLRPNEPLHNLAPKSVPPYLPQPSRSLMFRPPFPHINIIIHPSLPFVSLVFIAPV